MISGADIEDLKRTAVSMRLGATQIRESSQRVRSVLVRARWLGSDADALLASWNARGARKLQDLAHLLDRAAAALEGQANEQEGASGVSANLGFCAVPGGGVSSFSADARGVVKPVGSSWPDFYHVMQATPVVGNVISVGEALKGFAWDAPRAGFKYGFADDRVSDAIGGAVGDGLDGAVGFLTIDGTISVEGRSVAIVAIVDDFFGTDLASLDPMAPSFWTDRLLGLEEPVPTSIPFRDL